MRAFPERFFAVLDNLLVAVACAFMVLMTVHVVADIGSRLVFRQSLEATTEVVSYYYMVGIAFLPLLHLRRSRSMIQVEFFSALFSARVSRVLDVSSDLLLAAWFLLCTWYTAKLAVHKTGLGEFVDTTVDILRIWPTRWILPAAMGIAGTYCLLVAWRRCATNAVEEEAASEGGLDAAA